MRDAEAIEHAVGDDDRAQVVGGRVDGRWVAISGGTQQIADRVLRAIERPDLIGDPRFRDAAARRANADELDALVAAWIARRPLDVVLDRFERSQAPIAPVCDVRQILDDPQYQARESFVRCTDPDLGEVTIPGIVPRLSRTPGRIRWTGPAAIGADTGQVLEELGLPRPAAPRRSPNRPAGSGASAPDPGRQAAVDHEV